MKKKLLALMLFVGVAAFGQFSVGIRIGPPPQPRVVHVRPPSPGPGYLYVDGYWYTSGNHHYVWHDGYWTRPPYQGAFWIAPRYEGDHYYQGYWSGNGHEPMGHDHKWDKDKKYRDYREDRH